MRNLIVASLLLSTLLVGTPGVAQTCNSEVSIGRFDLEFIGAVFDGMNTQFTYCVTANPGAKALSHWVLELDVTCVKPEDLVSCGPQPCFYQENDPTTGLTGIKWDDTQVEPGETECFDFTLEGDWTSQLANTTAGLKAGSGASTGEICGPSCQPCEVAIDVTASGSQVWLDVTLTHWRPPTEIRIIEYALVDSSRTIFHTWEEGPITFSYGTTYQSSGPIPNLGSLAPGEYILLMRLDGMSQWHWRTWPFVVE